MDKGTVVNRKIVVVDEPEETAGMTPLERRIVTWAAIVLAVVLAVMPVIGCFGCRRQIC